MPRRWPTNQQTKSWTDNIVDVKFNLVFASLPSTVLGFWLETAKYLLILAFGIHNYNLRYTPMRSNDGCACFFSIWLKCGTILPFRNAYVKIFNQGSQKILGAFFLRKCVIRSLKEVSFPNVSSFSGLRVTKYEYLLVVRPAACCTTSQFCFLGFNSCVIGKYSILCVVLFRKIV